jgi:uncharacterized protein (TIGR02646 family)
MKNISKKPEPRSLTEYRTQSHSNYDGCNKQDIRESLVEEQGGICCYCMCRIDVSSAGMKVEHWQCQSRFGTLQLTYSNMLGACLGGEGTPRQHQTCDTHKGEMDSCKNPANSSHNIEQFIKYFGDGRIEATDPQVNKELNDVLNLNHPRLVNYRREVLAGFITRFPKQGRVSPAQFRKWRREWSTPDRGQFRPFGQVIVYWLDKKLARGN